MSKRSDPPKRLQSVKPSPVSAKRTILLVDDEPLVLESLIRQLQAEPDLIVCTAESGLEALQLLPALHDCRLVVADQLMRGMDGLQLLRLVRDRWPACRRILYTGVSDSELVLEGTGVAHRMLTKQMDGRLVRDAILREARRP